MSKSGTWEIPYTDTSERLLRWVKFEYIDSKLHRIIYKDQIQDNTTKKIVINTSQPIATIFYQSSEIAVESRRMARDDSESNDDTIKFSFSSDTRVSASGRSKGSTDVHF